jgi:hypothetical protein
MKIEDARRFYAEEIRAVANVQNDALELRRDAHEPAECCWLHVEGFCLSTLPPSPEQD